MTLIIRMAFAGAIVVSASCRAAPDPVPHSNWPEPANVYDPGITPGHPYWPRYCAVCKPKEPSRLPFSLQPLCKVCEGTGVDLR